MGRKRERAREREKAPARTERLPGLSSIVLQVSNALVELVGSSRTGPPNDRQTATRGSLKKASVQVAKFSAPTDCGQVWAEGSRFPQRALGWTLTDKTSGSTSRGVVCVGGAAAGGKGTAAARRLSAASNSGLALSGLGGAGAWMQA